MKIGIITGGRADWGLLSPLAKALQTAGVAVDVYVTNMHLMDDYGATWREIAADGFAAMHKLPAGGTRAEIAAQVMAGLGSELQGADRPDALVILGDRFEMYGAAGAALMTGVPVVHIAGGTVSYGAIDESVRHAISKCATLHLTETERCAGRLLRMGEDPAAVVVTGAIGCWNAIQTPMIPANELSRELGFLIDKDTLVGTMHPSTLCAQSPAEQMKVFVEALEAWEGKRYVLTYPNNDTEAADEQSPLSILRRFAGRNRHRVLLTPSLGWRRYLSAVAASGGCIGNSSSGLVEVPSLGVPTLNIGSRQDGRESAPSVINCDCTPQAISAGLARMASADHRAVAARRENPYYKPDTLRIMVDAITRYPFTPYPRKLFHEQ